ncbi:hypothetical protein PLICRDRAFT_120315, partial [Plicaturopsis crispa FD-325 SS-3]
MKFRTNAKDFVIPVILGSTIARRDRGEEERHSWARSILILFKPWRSPGDLRLPHQSWYDTFLQFEPSMKPRHLKIVRNI